jgi:hypothetical protein
MAKPSTIPQWDSNQTNVATPPAGKKTDGWTNGETGDSSWMNWFMYWVYQWIVWLDAGVWTAVSLTLSGNLNVAGITATGMVQGAALKYTGTLARALDFRDAFDETAGCTIATHTRSLDQLLFGASAVPVYVPVRDLTPGDIITAYNIDLHKNTNNTNTITAALAYHDGAGETIVGGTTITDNSNAPGLIIFAATGLAVTVVSGRRYYVKITPGGGAAPAADQATGITVSWKNA